MDIDIVIRALQTAIAPCVLISGTGLLLLTMTNRLSRITDRLRHLCEQIERSTTQKKIEDLKHQSRIIYKRGEFLRIAVLFAVLNIFLISLVILMLFSVSISSFSLTFMIKLAFEAALICLSLSVVFLLADVFLSLKALHIEIRNVIGDEK